MRYGEDAKFIETLLALREQFDLYPWAEVARAEIVPGVAGDQTFSLVFRSPDSLIVSEITHAGFAKLHIENPQPVNFWAGVSWKAKLKIAHESADVAQQRQTFWADNIFGSSASEWSRLGRGLLVRPNQIVTIEGLTNTSSTGIVLGEMQAILRGYKLLPKGTIVPRQCTLTEWQKDGRTLAAYKEGLSVELGAAVEEMNASLTLEDDFVIESISARARGVGNNRREVATSLTMRGEREVQSGLALSAALVGERVATRWDLPLPITSRKGQQWQFRIKCPVDEITPTPVDVEIVLHGYRMR